MADPASMTNAVTVMIVITLGIVIFGGLAIWVFDKRDFPDLGGALWYALQTVTTVGYGDAVPQTAIGRIVGASVMVVGVALIAILTASITSVFVEAGRRRSGRDAVDSGSGAALQSRLDEVLGKLALMEATLAALEQRTTATTPAQDRP